MKFVYSNWYIVVAILLVLIVASIVTFVLMDKKDRQLIQDFVNKNKVESAPAEPKAEPVAETVTEETKE